VIDDGFQGGNPSIVRALEAILDIQGVRPDEDAILLAQLRNQIDLLLADCARAITDGNL
jgi:hypothetical protein